MKIKKEYILIVLIILGVLVLEWITNSVSEGSVKAISKDFDLIIQDLKTAKKQNEENRIEEELIEDLNKKVKDMKNVWSKEEDKLSMFAEHNELEKVTTSLVLLEENIENGQFNEALANGKEFLYKLNHIKEKDNLELKNIF